MQYYIACSLLIIKQFPFIIHKTHALSINFLSSCLRFHLSVVLVEILGDRENSGDGSIEKKVKKKKKKKKKEGRDKQQETRHIPINTERLSRQLFSVFRTIPYRHGIVGSRSNDRRTQVTSWNVSLLSMVVLSHGKRTCCALVGKYSRLYLHTSLLCLPNPRYVYTYLTCIYTLTP
jgi:hypothetical protein